MEFLNERQFEAVTYGDGPLLVLAGAGSGKTRVLTYRIAYLIRERDIAPWNILAVTFTNKAAGEMRERIANLLGSVGREVTIGTFHSVCAGILRNEIDHLGYSSNFVIYDDKDQLIALKTVLERLRIDEKVVSPKKLQSMVNAAKNKGISPSEFVEDHFGFFKDKIAIAIEEYDGIMKKGNALDFGDLIYLTVRLFRKNPEILDYYSQRWRFILVDEYQDTNPAQYAFLNLLAGKAKNITVVGDDDQSIYRWRGADIQNILDFERDFPGAKQVRLEQNYRSTQKILDASGAVVAKNIGRMGKRLWTEAGEGEPLVVCGAANEYKEARFLADEIESIRSDSGMNYNDFAVFYRTNAQSRVIEDELVKRGIPYMVIGGLRFYDRMEIKDVLAYLRVVINPDDTVALKRIINTPLRGIGKKSVDALEKKALVLEISLYDAVKIEKDNKNVIAFRSLIERLREVKDRIDPVELVRKILVESRYLDKLADEGTIEARSRLDNLEELEEAVREMASENEDWSIEAFLEKAALMTELDSYNSSGDSVALMTLHSAKGLEFGVVFITGMEEGLFPHSLSKDDAEAMEEERRLCYVGMTRAMKRLYLTYARKRRVFGSDRHAIPSRYLSDIPEQLVVPVNFAPSALQGDSLSKDFFTDRTPPYSTKANGHGISFSNEKGLAELDGYPKGCRVVHPTFGEGVVRGGEGSGDKMKISVYFPRLGLKKLVLKYAALEKL